MFKIEDDKILWEGRVVATFVGGLPATLRDNVESALECYEKDSVSRKDYEDKIHEIHDEYSECVSGEDFDALTTLYEKLKDKYEELKISLTN